MQGDIGDENTLGNFLQELTLPGPVSAIDKTIEDEQSQSHQQITVTVDIHPVPPEFANTEIPSVDPIASVYLQYSNSLIYFNLLFLKLYT